MVSIILPTYNGEAYIAQSIESILSQTYKKFALIIVNDCSTDHTLEIIQRYKEKDARIRVINNIVNKKLPCSLNIGFSDARGDYYTWTSDDNCYHPDAIEKMVEYLEHHVDVDLVCASFDKIGSNGEQLGHAEEIDGNFEELYLGNKVGACFLYKSIVHKKLSGYDENLFLVEDYDFWLRAYRYFKFGFIRDCLYDYRIHDSSLSNKRVNDVLRKTYALLERELELNVIPNESRKKIYAKLIDYYYTQKYDSQFRDYMHRMKKVDNTMYRNLAKRYKLAMIIGIKRTEQLIDKRN